MATFALVHGAWHGGWHWHAVTDLLHERGHTVVAPDVPFDEPDVGARACAQVVVDAIDALGESGGPLVVVGHSYGGLILPVVATMIPTSLMVFVVGLVPRVGIAAVDHISKRATSKRFSDSMAGRLEMSDDGSSRWSTLTDAAETFYDELPRGVALVAASHLRPLHYTVWEEPCPVDGWPDVPSAYLLFDDDHVLNPAWLRDACRSQLGIAPVELSGGHNLFLSRPAQFVDALLQQVEQSAVDEVVG